MRLFITTLFILLLNCISFAQPGSIDSTFGTNGIVRTFVKSKNDVLNFVAIQADDKILAGGYVVYDTTTTKNAFSLVRYHANGSIDSSFANNGKMIYSFGGKSAISYAVKTLPDGRILMAGFVTIANQNVFAAIRLYTDGSIDTSFANNGELITTIGTTDDRALSIYLHPDNSFLLGGFSIQSVYQRMAVARYSANGEIDTTFGSAGIVLKTVYWNILCKSIETDSANRYIFAGNRTLNTYASPFMMRYSNNGIIDTAFGNLGNCYLGVGNSSFNEYITSMIKQTNGNLLIGLSATNNATNKFGVQMSLPSSCSLDTSFGIYNGLSYINTGNNNYSPSSVMQQNDGKIVIGATYQLNSVSKFACMRYTAVGLVDSTFGTNGLAVINTITAIENGTLKASALQSDGKLILAGEGTINNVNRYMLIRLKGYSNMTVDIGSQNIPFERINLYPNPVSNTLHIELNTASTNLSIQNIVGETIYTKSNCQALETIDMNCFTRGVYIVKANNSIAKFCKE